MVGKLIVRAPAAAMVISISMVNGEPAKAAITARRAIGSSPTNIAAMNSYRNLTVTEGQMGKSLEKLSSGFRINRAADDAGLTVEAYALHLPLAGDDTARLAEIDAWVPHLEPGDIIATGTPAGVAGLHKPPAWLKPGSTVEVEVEEALVPIESITHRVIVDDDVLFVGMVLIVLFIMLFMVLPVKADEMTCVNTWISGRVTTHGGWGPSTSRW